MVGVQRVVSVGEMGLEGLTACRGHRRHAEVIDAMQRS